MSLTQSEISHLNNLSRARNPNLLLGDLLKLLPEFGTPIEAAVAAETDLTIAGVVIHRETVAINNPSIDGSDVYEFLADTAQQKMNVNNIAIDITGVVDFATVTLTVDVQPVAGNTMTIGTKVYTFVANGTARFNGQIGLGTNLAGTQTAIVAAINGTDGHNFAHPLVSAAAFATNNCVITALIGGTSGNSIASTETFTPVSDVFSSATLLGGTDATLQEGVTALVAAITAYDTQGVGAVDATGGVVTLSADVAGSAGNLISVEETMVNGVLSSDLLEGGLDISPKINGKLMIGASNLYVYNGTSWKAIALP